MAKHIAIATGARSAVQLPESSPRHRAEDRFVPVRDVWTTPEDIKEQRHEFDTAQERKRSHA